MSLPGKLIGFGIRQAIGIVAGEKGGDLAEKVAGPVIQRVEQHFADHSKTLPNALARANDRSWQALSIALAGDGFLDKIAVFFKSGDDKGIREQVRLFLKDNSTGYEGTSAEFRSKCLTELNKARKKGSLSAQKLSAHDVARRTADFQRYADPKGMVDGAVQVMGQIADDLASDYVDLATLLRQPLPGGPPLLVSAFAYFFRREVETNAELARGLVFVELRQLSASQDKAFAEVNMALNSLGDQFEQVFEKLDRIEIVGIETKAVAVAMHGAVLDIQAELERLSNLPDELRRLMQDVLHRVSQVGMSKGEVKPHHGFSIRSEDERNAVKQLLARFRRLPDHQQKQVPALLNGLGKLQFSNQDFDGARQTFVAVAQEVHDAAAQAEAQYNVYRAALEEKKWDEALTAIEKASSHNSARFAPFPDRYQPKRILGAGGFGTVFLCQDTYASNNEVAIKAIHTSDLSISVAKAFAKAQTLSDLSHPSIIGVRHWDYADSAKTRPYIVMDYFRGDSLGNYIEGRGTISPDELIAIASQIAHGIKAAHQKNILHRDLKPDNILVRKEGSTWAVKIIDFGLALEKQTIETSIAGGAAGNTILGESVAGTIDYAPPEQMGKLKGVDPGPYSDVYSFGKLCCYALFNTTEPLPSDWRKIPDGLVDLLEKCLEKDTGPGHRFPNFEPVLRVLESQHSVVSITNGGGKGGSEPPPRNNGPVRLIVTQDEARRHLQSIRHDTFRRGLEQSQWEVDSEGFVMAHSVCWLFCWAKTGMNSRAVADVSRRVFDTILDVPYKDFDDAVKHVWAQNARKRKDQMVDEELNIMLANIARRKPMKERADLLFDELQSECRLISYIDAYQVFFGTRPNPFRNIIHCPEVTSVALRSKSMVSQGIEIQLDALIVSREGREPGEGHFQNKQYTRGQWQSAFQNWKLRQHRS